MKILITGGLGFIGQHLSQVLSSNGHELLLIDSLTPQIHGEIPSVNVPSGVTIVRMDICDIADRYELLEDVDVIFHLAAETGTAQSMYKMSHYSRVNCGGTTALLEAIARCKKRPKKFILASSRSVYGEGAYTSVSNPGEIITAVPRNRDAMDACNWEPLDASGRKIIPVATPESFPILPGSIYAATKAAQELLLTSSAAALNIQAVIFRFQNVYGQGQSLRNPYTGIISIFFNRARQGLYIPVYEDGLESRDFIHIKDIVEALSSSVNLSLPSGIIINIGSGLPTTVMNLAETLLKVSNFKVPIQITGQYRAGDIRHNYADITLLQKYLNFEPRISLEQGLKEFCEWALTQPIHEDLSVKAEFELKSRGLASK